MLEQTASTVAAPKIGVNAAVVSLKLGSRQYNII